MKSKVEIAQELVDLEGSYGTVMAVEPHGISGLSERVGCKLLMDDGRRIDVTGLFATQIHRGMDDE